MTAQADALMGIFGFKRVEGDSMDKVSDTRRGLFEKWAVANLPTSLSMRGSSYASLTTQKSWEGFNAALDAVEIVLPSEEPGYMYYAPDVVRAIESIGLGLRIK